MKADLNEDTELSWVWPNVHLNQHPSCELSLSQPGKSQPTYSFLVFAYAVPHLWPFLFILLWTFSSFGHLFDMSRLELPTVLKMQVLCFFPIVQWKFSSLFSLPLIILSNFFSKWYWARSRYFHGIIHYNLKTSSLWFNG